MNNIVTYKFEYTCVKKEDKTVIKDYIKRFNNLLRCTYNHGFKQEHFTQKDLYQYAKTLNNVTLECGLVNGAIYKAKELLNQQKESFDRLNKKRKSEKIFERTRKRKILFGGKTLWTQYLKGLISKEEFKEKRNFPVYSVGESNLKSNRHFELKENLIIFKPNKELHIPLNVNISRNYKKDLTKLIELQNNKEIPITYQLDNRYIYITFDLNKVREQKQYNPIIDRFISIDMNPNYIGYSIIDWKDENKYKILDSGVISNEKLNEHDNSLKDKGFSVESRERKYVINKRNYEVCQIAKQLVKIAKHYKVEAFGIEDLSIEHADLNKGKKTNKLCNNQWCRSRFVVQLEKECKLNSIKLIKVKPEYSSFIGNIIFRNCNLPDMVLASIEINRRTYELVNQYQRKTKDKKKNIIVPDESLYSNQIKQALEEIGYIGEMIGLRKLYYLFKNMKMKYRVPLTSIEGKVFSLLSTKSYLNLYKFNSFCT